MAKSEKTTAKSDTKVQLVLNAELFWAHVTKPNEMSGKFQANLKISDKDAKKLGDLDVGIADELKIGKKENGKDDVIEGNFVTAKNSFRPEIVDSKLRDLPKGLELGNGTKAKVVVTVFEWTFKKKSGVSLSLDTIQVLELVEYKRKSGKNLLEEAEGFEFDGDSSDAEEDEDDDEQDDSDDVEDEDTDDEDEKPAKKKKKGGDSPY